MLCVCQAMQRPCMRTLSSAINPDIQIQAHLCKRGRFLACCKTQKTLSGLVLTENPFVANTGAMDAALAPSPIGGVADAIPGGAGKRRYMCWIQVFIDCVPCDGLFQLSLLAGAANPPSASPPMFPSDDDYIAPRIGPAYQITELPEPSQRAVDANHRLLVPECLHRKDFTEQSTGTGTTLQDAFLDEVRAAATWARTIFGRVLRVQRFFVQFVEASSSCKVGHAHGVPASLCSTACSSGGGPRVACGGPGRARSCCWRCWGRAIPTRVRPGRPCPWPWRGRRQTARRTAAPRGRRWCGRAARTARPTPWR